MRLEAARPWPAAALDELAAALDAVDERHIPADRLAFLVALSPSALQSLVLRAVRLLNGPSNPETWADFLARESAQTPPL